MAEPEFLDAYGVSGCMDESFGGGEEKPTPFRTIRYLALLLWTAALILYLCGSARADVGGSIPAPGLCDYPSICTSGAAFGEYDYAESWPLEVNGSRRTCLLGGAMYEGTGGVSFMFVNFSVTTPLGVIRGACWYACPGPFLEQAEWPNPPGAWKNYLRPAVCKPIGPAPIPINPSPNDAPPKGESVVSPSAPLPPGPAPPPLLPNQTNPGASSPFQPEESH